jgi:hypothetical protein
MKAPNGNIVVTIASLIQKEPRRKKGFLQECKESAVKWDEAMGLCELTVEERDRIKREWALEHALPGIGQMVRNAAGAAGRALMAAVKGDEVLCSDEETERRTAICRECEFYRPSDTRCSKCGCSTDKWVRKTRFATEHCPVAKW